MVETRGRTIFAVLGEYHGVVREVLQRPQTLYTGAIMLIIAIVGLINGSFWAILVTENSTCRRRIWLDLSLHQVGVVLGFFFIVMPRLASLDFKWPMFAGFLAFMFAQIL
jgi:hypothetical protein